MLQDQNLQTTDDGCENFYSIGTDGGFKACPDCFGAISFRLYYNSRIEEKWVASTGKA